MAETSVLVTKTRELLHADKRSIPDIFKESGIPYYWLQNFSRNAMKNPSVYKVEKLYTFLSGKELSL